LLKQLTLDFCADRLGVTLGHLSHVERGSRTPSVDLIARMASITDGVVTQEEILRFATEALPSL